MPNVYLGTTPISVGEVGTTNVAKIYLGDTQVWPSAAAGIAHVNNFSSSDVSMYNTVGTLATGFTSGALVVTQSGTFTGDKDFWLSTPMLTDDMIVRFKSSASSAARWYASAMLRANAAGTDRVGANFANNALYLEDFEGAHIADWRQLTTSTANIATNTIVEISAIGDRYSVVYETSAGVRTDPVAFYPDTAVAYPVDSSHRYCGFRIGRSGTNNSVGIFQIEMYDSSVWPVHQGLTKSGTQTTAAIGTYQRVTGHIARIGYPQTRQANNVLTMTGAGTINIDARVQMTSGTSRTQQARLVKNGSTVIWESSVTTSGTTSIAMPQQTGLVVAAGDTFELQHKLVSGTSTTIAAGAAVTYLYSTPTAPGA